MPTSSTILTFRSQTGENISALSNDVITDSNTISDEDYSVFWQQHQGKKLLFVVYVDGIIVTNDDVQGITDLKSDKKTWIFAIVFRH